MHKSKMSFYHQQVVLLRNKNFPNEDLCRQVVQAKKFIDEHFDNSIVLQDIARAACYSKFHFLRLFKLMYGKTPHQYLTSVRIGKAKELLQTGMPVLAVCFSVGFDSVSSFKGLFKRCTTHTPAFYQKQIKHKKEIAQSPLRFLPFFFSFKKSNF